MKKLVALMIVVSLASVSFGTISWDVPQTAPAAGSTVAVSLVTDTALVGSGGYGDFKLNVSAGEYVDGSISTTQTVYFLIPFGANETDLAEGFDLQITGNTLDTLAAGELFTFEFVMPEVPVTISHLSGSINNQVTEIADVTIPEPITVALFGLGGLFLRRRS